MLIAMTWTDFAAMFYAIRWIGEFALFGAFVLILFIVGVTNWLHSLQK